MATFPMQRVGMFGGAFDPPHLAHRRLAETALTQLGLDRLHVIPTGQAWHKARVLSAAPHRLAMCELAFGDLPGVKIDDREIRRKGPSYTADTLAELRALYPNARLYLILGADQLLSFRSWVRWQEVLEQARLAVADRPLDETATEQGDRAVCPDLSEVDLPFEALHMPAWRLSATAVRQRAASDARSIGQMVPEAVSSYISQHSLYPTSS
ncbi:MAG TPA: nicotinate (nicotinamide) nucleotide adenylyltransferase [Hydrogenophaga sp.]|uniref:nicotinate (nicotinamide) nucleotide adenylyltransferase n=1 Tax=Hydrogenophaga sp. TaxID=1904254 RepID=UPI002C0DB30C|nr:nicotinate (nicotinamide) nucleotide adenylyltransferase [Hydrogenophaga sp.]HMN92414.1 nicotinate (nicotinamide) nucleotide adenylyltransferase [Hydrogenophaga sp.]HMP10186.1 nicotinate (nicotinamide) nucleotide adenylyltransferase [Hydrogenophaga sp.]